MDPALALEVAALARRRDVDEATAPGDSAVQQFYRDAVLFVTGGSGFVGKHLVEKLLRSCEVKRVYLLIRAKKGRSIQERLTQIFQDPVFDTLQQLKPDFQQRVTAVEGDVTKLRLGISDQDWQMLANEVSVFFHVAATTTFDLPLRSAMLTNVRGTTQALLLGQDCKHIKSFVYMSTAYTHATHRRVSTKILEEFYDSPARPDTIIDLVQQLSEDKLAAIKSKLIEDWANTYTFSKAIAEESVRTMAGDLPVCIVRPAIVISSLLEPTPGWLDTSSVYGPSAVLLGWSLGVVRTFLADKKACLDLIPVDYVTNATLAAGWLTAQRRARGHHDTKIYAVAPARNPLKWKELISRAYTAGATIPSPRAMWYIYECATKHHALFELLTWLLHYIPGYLVDGVLRLLGRKPMAMKLYTKVNKLSYMQAFVVCNEFYFDDFNLQNLHNSLSAVDKRIYNFDITKLEWREMMNLWVLGLRKYIIKDGLKDTEYAKKKQFVFKILNYKILALYAYAMYKLCKYVISLVRRVCMK